MLLLRTNKKKTTYRVIRRSLPRASPGGMGGPIGSDYTIRLMLSCVIATVIILNVNNSKYMIVVMLIINNSLVIHNIIYKSSILLVVCIYDIVYNSAKHE